MKVYVAGNNQQISNKIANTLRASGFTIVSSWLNEKKFNTKTHTKKEKQAIAHRDYNEVCKCDMLILISSPHYVPGGKFVETGIALGRRKKVIVIGHIENMLLWNVNIMQFNTIEQFIESYYRNKEIK